MDKLLAMRTFVRVVEAGSFSAVAHESGTTQSAVSKQVAALERELGAKLLTRTTRSLALTEDGARYFEETRRLVAEIAEAESTLQRGEQQLTGRLRIAASVGFGRMKLMPLVRSFLAENPGVKIDLRLHDNFIDLVEHGIDIAVRIGELPDSRLIARRIGTAERRLLAHRRYLRSLPKGMKAPKQLDDLTAHNCIVYTGIAARNDWTFIADAGASEPPGTTRSVRVDGNLQTNSSEVLRASILAGMGIGHAPAWLFDEEIASGEVVTLLPDWHTFASPIHLVSPPERRHSAKVKAFADHVAAGLAQPAAGSSARSSA